VPVEFASEGKDRRGVQRADPQTAAHGDPREGEGTNDAAIGPTVQGGLPPGPEHRVRALASKHLA
jgi:hypothetical protein